ncbi:hypothetical protein LCGC14_2034730 [marine sediment metagenome]|uniref:VWFA domain-containing protein n=1 Tax=marine sediment metagenome TaxID=412755 RepID=A0A0F9FG73_9ZZZZ
MDKLQKGHSAVAEGSIFDAASRRGDKPEETLADADVVIMLDCSSSMSEGIAGGTETRYDEAKKAVADIQRAFPGRVVLVSFASHAQLELTGIPQSPNGSTNMREALEIAKQFDGLDTKFYLVSDGFPDSQGTVLELAKTFEDPINVIFIGDDYTMSGMEFLGKVADITGGTDEGQISPKMLGDTMKLLITGQ